MHLPQETFTLTEWIQFVDEHPEYLTVNTPDHLTPQAIVMALERSIDNVTEYVTPLMILKEKLSRENFIKFQRAECTDLYNKCLASENFEHTVGEGNKQKTYKLEGALLLVKGEADRVLVPNTLVGPLLSHTHLHGHKGLNRMLANLESYFFPSKYTVARKFISSCYGCFLSQTGSKHVKLGMYPVPDRPFSEIMYDMAENLNVAKGFQHMLVIQCLLTDFVILCPLRTKKASEIEHVLTLAVLQQHNVEKVHSDNGPGLRSLQMLSILSALHIKVVATASLSPRGRGKIESLVKITKLMIKRILATKPTYNWAYLPLICAIALNTSVSPRTGFKPIDMVRGSGAAGLSFLDLEGIAAPHYMVKNNKMRIEELNRELQESTRVARERLQEIQYYSHQKLNKTKIERKFKPNDYVFVLDRAITPGASRPLKTKLQPAPYVVVYPLHVTSVVKRLSDGFTAMYSNNDLKKFTGGNPLFADLPPEVTNILLYKFKDLLSEDFSTIMRYDPLTVPDALPLHDLESGEPRQISDGSNKITETVSDLTEDPDFVKYLSDQERELIKDDINKLRQESNDSRLTGDESDESDDSDNQEQGWTGRLRKRNKTGKSVRFK